MEVGWQQSGKAAMGSSHVVMQIVCSWGITLLLSGTSQFCAAAYTTRREQPKKNRMLKSMCRSFSTFWKDCSVLTKLNSCF